ncbi:hypothetical protein LXL04_039354 [Taraxacum kok-saghyz]
MGDSHDDDEVSDTRYVRYEENDSGSEEQAKNAQKRSPQYTPHELIKTLSPTIHATFATVLERDDAFREARRIQLSKRGPFDFLDRIGPIAYRLSLPSELSNTFGFSLRQEIPEHKVDYEHRISPPDEGSEQMHYNFGKLVGYPLTTTRVFIQQQFPHYHWSGAIRSFIWTNGSITCLIWAEVGDTQLADLSSEEVNLLLVRLELAGGEKEEEVHLRRKRRARQGHTWKKKIKPPDDRVRRFQLLDSVSKVGPGLKQEKGVSNIWTGPDPMFPSDCTESGSYEHLMFTGDALSNLSLSGNVEKHLMGMHIQERTDYRLMPVTMCHTPKPGFRRKRLGAGDVIQVSQHITV